MKLGARRTATVVLLCSLALPAWGQQYYLYEPRPTVPDAKEQTKDGVLVKEVPVLEGDTLYGISRKFSGHGTYYPQILLFNHIKDPNLIYTGDTLKIPLPHGEIPDVPVSAVRPRSKTQKHTYVKKKSSVRAERAPEKNLSAAVMKKAGDTAPGVAAVDQMSPKATPDPQKTDLVVSRPVAVASQQLFEKAVKAYRQDDCRTALELFDRYLADNATSPMAADASLYKAECYLKLSAQ